MIKNCQHNMRKEYSIFFKFSKLTALSQPININLYILKISKIYLIFLERKEMDQAKKSVDHSNDSQVST